MKTHDTILPTLPLAGSHYYPVSKSSFLEHVPDQELFQPSDGFEGLALTDPDIFEGIITS